ncbi:MAG: LPS export ABC transporter periplasmic protein LptC [Desulfuromonas sp.]|nr:MAG: LPS export ABC transporter periplasmic protein LptC [Desulfuromonas sp.]
MADWFSARVFLAGFILLLAMLLTALVVGNLRQRQPDVVADFVRPNADLAMQKVNYTETRDGQRKWSVQADSATHDREQNMTRIHNVRIVVFGREQGDILATAESGSFDSDKRTVVLSGQVVVENIDGFSIFTEDLFFDGATRVLKSSESVYAKSAELELTAVGLRYDIDQGNLKLLDSVKAEFKGAMRLP